MLRRECKMGRRLQSLKNLLDTVRGGIVFILEQEDHPKFKREGDDLHVEHTLSLMESLSGFQFVLAHLDCEHLRSNPPMAQPILKDCFAAAANFTIMAKKRSRQQNPEPFLPDHDAGSVASTKTRSKAPKYHQKPEVISSGMSSKILKEALLQQKEIEAEEAQARNPAFFEEKVPQDDAEEADDEDPDAFNHFTEAGNQLEIDEDDERLMEQFYSLDAGPQRTLADFMIDRIKENKVSNVSTEPQLVPKLDEFIKEMYKVGECLSKYTSGKIPKAFKYVPSMQHWEAFLHLTEPEKWSPCAMFEATKIFASNLGSKKVEQFYKLVLLPRIRGDIQKNKRLHFSLHQALRKSLYKPAAFNKGILFPLCKSGTCTRREADIVGSIIEKYSIPVLHSCVALLKLAEMEYCGTTSYFIKLLLDKKYSLSIRVIVAVVAHFMRFFEDPRLMPVIWHQSLLTFVQRYKNDLLKEDKENLRRLVQRQKHYKVTPEIVRELDNSRNRGEEEDPMSTTSVSVINRTIEEDRFDIPDVPMEED